MRGFGDLFGGMEVGWAIALWGCVMMGGKAEEEVFERRRGTCGSGKS